MSWHSAFSPPSPESNHTETRQADRNQVMIVPRDQQISPTFNQGHSQTPKTMETRILQPNKHDVLMGRGGKNNRHVGNEKLRAIARERCTRYKQASKREKSSISRDIVNQIRSLSPPGRFLKHTDIGTWEDVGDEIAREKASQVLRDAVAYVMGPVPNLNQPVQQEELPSPPPKSAPMEEASEENDAAEIVVAMKAGVKRAAPAEFLHHHHDQFQRNRRHHYQQEQEHPPPPQPTVHYYPSYPTTWPTTNTPPGSFSEHHSFLPVTPVSSSYSSKQVRYEGRPREHHLESSVPSYLAPYRDIETPSLLHYPGTTPIKKSNNSARVSGCWTESFSNPILTPRRSPTNFPEQHNPNVSAVASAAASPGSEIEFLGSTFFSDSEGDEDQAFSPVV